MGALCASYAGGADMSITTEEIDRLAQTHDLVRFTLGMKAPEHDLTAAALRSLAAERDALKASKDAAYEERNRVVALLAAVFLSVRARTAIEGWSEDWHGCVYITLPTGQASWHYHDSHAHLFAHVPEGAAIWDGHTPPEKYERVAAACAERDALKAEAERLKAGGCARDQSTTQFCAEAVALKAENARLRPESRKLRRLVRTLLENDPDDMAADGVTVLDVWRKEAREFFDARNKARQAHMEKMRADHAAEIRAAVRSSVLGEKE